LPRVITEWPREISLAKLEIHWEFKNEQYIKHNIRSECID
jgi:hypothetical protein